MSTRGEGVRETERQSRQVSLTENAAFMAAMRSLCGPLELDMAYVAKLELFVDVLCITIHHTRCTITSTMPVYYSSRVTRCTITFTTRQLGGNSVAQ